MGFAESWLVIGFVCAACGLFVIGICRPLLDRLEDWRARKRRDRDVAELLQMFPVQTPAHEKAIFEALMGHRYQNNVVPFEASHIRRI